MKMKNQRGVDSVSDFVQHIFYTNEFFLKFKTQNTIFESSLKEVIFHSTFIELTYILCLLGFCYPLNHPN